MEVSEKRSDGNVSKQISLIEKFKCTEYYFALVDCVEKKGGDEKTCRDLFVKIGECVRNGMKEEEKTKFI
jgi:hypothetical protein